MSDVFVWPISINNQFDDMIGGKQGSSEIEFTIQFLEVKVNRN